VITEIHSTRQVQMAKEIRVFISII